jgi:aryl-alcohol dehydrogenase-like predicted oxidoreductase
VLGSAAGAGVLASSYPSPAAASAPKLRITNEVVSTINGIRQRRLGTTDIVVSEMGLGTQRWGSTDYNAPDEATCHAFLDRAVQAGVNLVDTAEQYPIPSGQGCAEGSTELFIGSWLRQGKSRRKDVVLSSKITGGRHVTPNAIRGDLEGSLRRLGTDYLDVYMLHWPARYSPQSNWGQSLAYDYDEASDLYYANPTSFAAIAEAMGQLVSEGKVRGWGLCNDNAYGVTACCAAAKALGVAPPCAAQNDFSLLNRRIEEDGLSEAMAPPNENVGFMAYNVLAGGVLSGKYLVGPPPSVDNPNRDGAKLTIAQPRGRHDTVGWGTTLGRYRSTAAEVATRQYAAIAKQHGLSCAELSLRWCRSRRAVTSSLVGTSTMAQLEANLQAFRTKEPLSEDVLWAIDRVHLQNRLPIFSNDQVGADWGHEGAIGERIP